MTSMSAIKTAVLGAALGLSALAAPVWAQQGMAAPAVAGTHQVRAQEGSQGLGKPATQSANKKAGKKAAPKKAAAKKTAKKPTKVAKRSRKAMPDKHHGSPTHRTSASASKASVKHASPHRG